MSLTIHPDAATRAEELVARAVVGLSEEPTMQGAPARPYTPEIPISGSIERSNIVGPFLSQQRDRFGRVVSRYYADDSGTLELTDEPHSDFSKSVRTLHRQPDIRNAVSESTVEKAAFEWICEVRRGITSERMVPYVVAKLTEMIQQVEVVLPIYGLHIEEPVRVGNVVLADLTEAEMHAWRLSSLQHAREHVDGVNQMHDKLRRRFQGRAVVRYSVLAEADYAVERAMDEAELSLAVLRLASVGAFVPEKATIMALAGRELVPRASYILLGPDASFSCGEGLLYAEDLDAWIITADEIGRVVSPVVGHWSALLAATSRSEFQDVALRSVLLYSRATRYRNISEKLIHIFSAAESLLLRNDNEPISSALADRLAFAVGRSADERAAIAKNLREVYALRSKFVHHGVEAPPEGNELSKLEKFLVTISQLFINLRDALATRKTKDEYLDALDRLKYS
jgi:hypothetical protein